MKRRKIDDDDDTAVIVKGGAPFESTTSGVKRPRKRLVLDDERVKKKDSVPRDNADNSFVFEQSRGRRINSKELKSTDTATRKRDQKHHGVTTAQRTTLQSPRLKRACISDVPAAEEDAGIHAATLGTIPTTGRRKARKRTVEKSCMIEGDLRPEAPTTTDQISDAVMTTRTRQARNATRSSIGVNKLTAKESVDADSVAQRAVVASVPSKRRRKAEETKSCTDDVNHQAVTMETSKRSRRAKRSGVVPVVTVCDEETQTICLAGQTRRCESASIRELKDVTTDVMNVSCSDNVVALVEQPKKQTRRGKLAKASAQARPGHACPKAKSTSALISEPHSERGTGLHRPANTIGRVSSEDGAGQAGHIDQHTPLIEVDVNLTRRIASPAKPKVSHARTVARRSELSIPGRMSVSTKPQSAQKESLKSQQRSVPHQVEDPIIRAADERKMKVSLTAFSDESNGSDARTHPKDSASAMTRKTPEDPAVRLRKRRYGENSDNRSLFPGTEDAETLVRRRDCAKTSTVSDGSSVATSSSTFEPAVTAVGVVDRNLNGSSGHANNEDLDWLTEPAKWVGNGKVSSIRKTAINDATSKKQTKVIDIDIDDLIRNITSFAKQEGLGKSATRASLSHGRAKAQRRR